MTMRKTYGVAGMMEWNALITAGRATVRVHFTGGTITGYGVTPATFSTDNSALQEIIENSYWYKKGRITIVNEIPND